MQDRTFFRPILDDESLTRGLGDEEARMLIDWLVERAENLVASTLAQVQRTERLESLCRRSRAISRFVELWCYQNRFGAAIQLAGAESFAWNLPVGKEDAAELMVRILRAEERADLATA